MTPRVIEEPNSAIPEAIGPKEKLDHIRKQLGTSLQGLSSKHEPGDKSVDVVNSVKSDEVTQPVHDKKNPNVHNFAAMRPQISRGQSTALSWSISNADRVRIEPGVGIVGTLGSAVDTPPKTTTYTLIAKNKAGESRVTQRIEVTDQSKANLRATAALDDRKRRGGR